MSDIKLRKYLENMPYGDDAKSSEIHGKANQQVINGFITSLAAMYDRSIENGDKDMAGNFDGAIKQIARDLDNLKAIKEEAAVNFGGGIGGKNVFSNFTSSLEFDRQWITENFELGFDNNMRPTISVMDENGEMITKNIEDLTQDWVVRGDEENQFMQIQQDAVKQSNTLGIPLDFDVDFMIDNLITNNDAWKIFVSDKIGGRYFFHDYLVENQDKLKSGEITDDMLHPLSFNPENDNRLHKYLTNRINKGFDQNYMSQEGMEADKLMAKLGQSNESTQQTKTRDKI